MRRRVLALVLSAIVPSALLAADKPQVASVSKPAEKAGVAGKLGIPFGEVATIQGFVVLGPHKGDEDGPNLRIQRVNGKATQQDIQIVLHPLGKFGEKRANGLELPKVEAGKTYEFKGYETGGYVGIPWEVYKDAGLDNQQSDHHFRHELVVYKGKATDPIAWMPVDFVGREALLEGKAVTRDNKAYIDGKGWQLLTDPAAAWPQEFEGKTVEGFGTVKGDAAKYQLVNGATRLVKLADQKGRTVSLRGTAWSVNGHWWFNYRGTDLYVEGMKELPGWTSLLHGCTVVITGTLDEADLPDLGDITRTSKPDKKKYFVVRKPGWKRLEALLAPERVEPE